MDERQAAERLQDELRRSDWDMGTVLELFASALTAARAEGEAKGREQGLREAAEVAQDHICSKSYGLCCCQGDIERDILKLSVAPAGVATTEGGGEK